MSSSLQAIAGAKELVGNSVGDTAGGDAAVVGNTLGRLALKAQKEL